MIKWGPILLKLTIIVKFTAKFIQGNHIVYKARLGDFYPIIQSSKIY
ncbi:hypothetical protein lpa_03748 [Legionella pneumophila 2300/99 Alcoy]|nr:hypothetical protein lpa_03748 [Legionella pneumophila 2300/99 Alcoy]